MFSFRYENRQSPKAKATITCHIRSYDVPICSLVIVPDLEISFGSVLMDPCEEFLERVDRVRRFGFRTCEVLE